MSEHGASTWRWLAAAVLGHLVISLVHGAAHARADVLLSGAGTAFVFIVILAGPLVGLALTWRDQRAGAWMIALTMAGSLAFGVVNHFLLDGRDHVAHVVPEWRTLFATSAISLVLTEIAGAGLAIRLLHARKPS